LTAGLVAGPVAGFTGAVVLGTSREPQLDVASQITKPSTMTLMMIRPGVQKELLTVAGDDSLLSGFPDESGAKAIDCTAPKN
jgi:hypothetical protein